MDQTEKAFQKQDAIFIGSKRFIGKKSKKAARYFRSVGLSIPTPKEAKESRYVDKKCPFTGNVSIRGKILKGMCISTKMKNTFIIKNADQSFDQYHAQMKKRKMFGGVDHNATHQNENKFGLIRGAKPTARDGHISIVDSKGYMYVFGGDRHLMPFNDLYMIKLQ